MSRQEAARGGKSRQESARVGKWRQVAARVDKSGQEAASGGKRRPGYLFIRNKWDDEDADNARSRQQSPEAASSRHVACTSSLQLMLYFFTLCDLK